MWPSFCQSAIQPLKVEGMWPKSCNYRGKSESRKQVFWHLVKWVLHFTKLFLIAGSMALESVEPCKTDTSSLLWGRTRLNNYTKHPIPLLESVMQGVGHASQCTIISIGRPRRYSNPTYKGTVKRKGVYKDVGGGGGERQEFQWWWRFENTDYWEPSINGLMWHSHLRNSSLLS